MKKKEELKRWIIIRIEPTETIKNRKFQSYNCRGGGS